MLKKKLLAVVGLTATGKTDVAIELAKKFNGEIVACDSRQVYVGLDLGSGKLPGGEVQYQKNDGYWLIDGIKIWLYDVADPKQQFDAAQYLDLAKEAIRKIVEQGKLPIIVGGTGLYLEALLSGIIEQSPVDIALREELNGLTLDQLEDRLRHLSQSSWDQLNSSDQKNSRRLIRAIEKLSSPKEEMKLHGLESEYQILKIGLMAPRPELLSRIEARVSRRLDMGMVEEVERLHTQGVSWQRMEQLGLEYGLLAKYCQQQITKEQFISQLNIRIGQYAKRQWVWFKRDQLIKWFDVSEANWQSKVTELVQDWYNK